MSSQQSEAASDASASVFHVSVVADGKVEVSGGTPQEVVDLLQSVGNQVVINGDILSQAEPEPLPLDDLNDLSERELQILALIASGHSNQDIAAEAFLSINTVKSYIRSAYRKMDVQTRSQAVIWAIDRGVVAAHPSPPD